MSITHRPERPRRGIAGIIHRHHRRDGEPTIEIEPVTEPWFTDESIHTWLNTPNTGPDDVQGIARMPFTVQPASPAIPVDLPGSPLMLEAGHVTVYRELDDDEAFAERLLSMERETQELADVLAGENDTRMQLLLARSRQFGERWEKSKAAAVFARRRELIRAMVPEVGHLLAWGDMSQQSAAFVMGLRSRFLSSPQPSQHLPKLTPELLAAMDAQKAATTAPAPWAPRVGDLVSYEHPTQRRTLVGTVVRLRRGRSGPVPSIRIRGKRTVFECLSAEGFTLLEGRDPEPGPACADCKGSGTYWWKRCGCAHGCSACEGSGHMGVFGCPTCEGSGNAAERRRVTVHAPGCEFDECVGCVVMPDEEGGYEVQLPGVDHLVHFERSELEFAAGAA